MRQPYNAMRQPYGARIGCDYFIFSNTNTPHIFIFQTMKINHLFVVSNINRIFAASL